MIRLKQNSLDVPVETTMTLCGEEFGITLLPLDMKKQLEAFSRFRKRKNVPNQLTGKMEVVEYFDDRDEDFMKVSDDLLCRHVIDFMGIAGPGGEPLDGKLRENKIKLGSVNVEDVEEIVIIDPETRERAIIPRPRKRLFRSLIFEKCNELAETIAEAEIKN